MVRVKGGGVLKYAGGLMGVDYGEASMESFGVVSLLGFYRLFFYHLVYAFP